MDSYLKMVGGWLEFGKHGLGPWLGGLDRCGGRDRRGGAVGGPREDSGGGPGLAVGGERYIWRQSHLFVVLA